MLALARCGQAAAPPLAARDDGGSDGYSLADGLWLGGDATVEVTVPQEMPASATLDELSLLLRWEPTPRLAFFTETKVEELVTLTEGEGIRHGSRVLSIERLYLDWSVTPDVTVRVGKFLTPFGLWNVIRRAPLAWTVERPLVTERFFPEHTTGLQLLYQTSWQGWSLDATGYGPAQEELALRGRAGSRAAESGTEDSGNIVGGRLAAGHTVGPAYVGLGLNGAGVDNRFRGPWHGVGGLDLDVTALGNLLTGELLYAHPRPGDASGRWGFYLQDVIPIVDRLYAVLRYERFEGRASRLLDAELIGLTWRPVGHVILKADYQFANHSRTEFERGFIASMTLFF